MIEPLSNEQKIRIMDILCKTWPSTTDKKKEFREWVSLIQEDTTNRNEAQHTDK